MATTQFNNIVLTVAQNLKAPRILATDDVDVYGNISPYSSSDICKYVNRAIREFLLDWFKKLGPKSFGEMFPEYIKTSGALPAGVTVKPSDCFKVNELKNAAGNVFFTRLKQSVVEDVRTGRHKIIIPSTMNPVFWEEDGNIYTLGVTSGNVIARYIRTHQDIQPVTAPVGQGNWLIGSNAGYNATTKVLSAVMNFGFTLADANKRIMFRTFTATYAGFIQSCQGPNDVVLFGDNLPAATILASGIQDVIVSDIDPDEADLKLNKDWHAGVIEMAVQYALADAKNSVVA